MGLAIEYGLRSIDECSQIHVCYIGLPRYKTIKGPQGLTMLFIDLKKGDHVVDVTMLVVCVYVLRYILQCNVRLSGRGHLCKT